MTKLLYLNIVITRYYFCVNICDDTSDRNHTYVFGSGSDERSDLLSVIRSYPKLIGYNVHRMDAVVLSYALFGNASTPEEIYEFKESMLTSRALGSLYSDKEYKEYSKRMNFTSIIDLKHTNSLSVHDILKVGISLGVDEISFIDETKGDWSSLMLEMIKESLKSKIVILKELFNRSLENLTIRRMLSEEYSKDLLSATDSEISEYIVKREYSDLSGEDYYQIRNNRVEYNHIELKELLPKMWYRSDNMNIIYDKLKAFTITPNNKVDYAIRAKSVMLSFKQGGMHSINKPSLYDNKDYGIMNIDFNTFYGNIMLKYGIYPSHVNKSFLTVVKRLMDRREKYRNVDADKDRMIKTVISSISGNLKSSSSVFKDYKTSIQLYMTGQLLLLKVIDDLEAIDGVECIMCNTDGVIIKYDYNAKDLLIDKMNVINFEINIPWTVVNINKLIIKDINNYIYIDEFESVTGVGIFRHKDKVNDSLNAPIIAEAVINYFLYGKPVKETLKDEEDILKFCMGEVPGNDYVFWKVDFDGSELIPSTMRYFASNKSENICYSKSSGKDLVPLKRGVSLSLLNVKDDTDYKQLINYQYYSNKASDIINDAEDLQLTLF